MNNVYSRGVLCYTPASIAEMAVLLFMCTIHSYISCFSYVKVMGANNTSCVGR